MLNTGPPQCDDHRIASVYALGVAEVERILRAYGDDDALVGEWPITGLRLQKLQELFGQADDMYDSYPVHREQAAALERATGITLDLDRYAYFVDAGAV